MVDRRGFLSSFAGAAAMGATLNFGGGLLAQLAQAPGQLPDRGLCDSNEEAYWTELRKQFLIPADECKKSLIYKLKYYSQNCSLRPESH